MAPPANCRIVLVAILFLLVFPAYADTGAPAPAATVSEIPVFTASGTPVHPVNETPEILPTPSGTPVPFTISLFIPTRDMIHSTQIMDMTNDPHENGAVVIATSFGLSHYNGTWSTRHRTLDNLSEGLMDDFVTAVEYDRDLNLWIGYSGGIQIFNGQYYLTIRDQQLLKDTRITDLQRWNDEMWVATGNAGLHRYRDGTWTWFQPESEGGPGFYEADSVALDSTGNASALLIATPNEGLWIVPSQEDPVSFTCIATHNSPYGLLAHVRRDPRGGVYFFNKSVVVHYSRADNFTPFLSSGDLAITLPAINDIAAGPDGTLYLATDRGIFIWQDGGIYRHLDRFEGIGTSPVVNTIFIDASDRVWFSTPDDVGFYRDRSRQENLLALETPAPTGIPSTPPVSPVTGTAGPAATGNAPPQTAVVTVAPEPGGVSGVLDPLAGAVRAFLSLLGIKI